MTPYFFRKTKRNAEIVIHDELPGHRMTFSAWKVLRAWWHMVTCPEFVDVDRDVFRHLEEAFRMMTNLVAKSTGNKRAVGVGVEVDVEWSGDNNLAILRVYPRSDKYLITIERDELGNVMITSPRMKFTNDIPGLNQARHVCGQVVQVATSMMAGG